METKLLTSLGKIAGIGGIALGVLLLVFRGVLATNVLSDGVIRILLVLTFGIAAMGLIAWVMTRSLRKSDSIPIKSVIILAVFSLCTFFSAITVGRSGSAVNTGPVPDDVTGMIDIPGNGGEVTGNFSASGTAQNVNKDTHLWLAVMKDKMTWPKAGRLFVDKGGHWSHEVFEEGTSPDGQFALCLWAADTDADTRMAIWLKDNASSKSFPALPIPSGARELWRVTGLRRKD